MTRVQHTSAIGPPTHEDFDIITEPVNDRIALSSLLDVHGLEAGAGSS
jgi:hypothetical protein